MEQTISVDSAVHNNRFLGLYPVFILQKLKQYSDKLRFFRLRSILTGEIADQRQLAREAVVQPEPLFDRSARGAAQFAEVVRAVQCPDDRLGERIGIEERDEKTVAAGADDS